MNTNRFNGSEKQLDAAKEKDQKRSGASLHAGHRHRVRQMFLENGLAGMPDHMVLELLLFYALPRRDTNAISHMLIQYFGSLRAVFDADISELKKVAGIGDSSALLIKLIPALRDRYSLYKVQKRVDFSSVERAADFFIDYYMTKTKEEVTALLLDNNGCLISFEKIHEGSVNSSDINPRRIAELALNKNAASIILAHNHPSGNAIPSDRDLLTTKSLMDVFSPIDLKVRAHLVVSGNQYTDIVKTLYDNARYQVRYIAMKDETGE